MLWILLMDRKSLTKAKLVMAARVGLAWLTSLEDPNEAAYSEHFSRIFYNQANKNLEENYLPDSSLAQEVQKIPSMTENTSVKFSIARQTCLMLLLIISTTTWRTTACLT